jgi:integrase
VFHGTSRQADTALARMVGEVDAAAKDAPAKGTFGELAERWYAHKLPKLKATTARNYRSLLDNRILAELGDVPVEKITVARLDRFYGTLSGLTPPLSPATVDRHHAIVRMVLNAGVRWEELGGNVAPRTERPKVHKYQANIPSPELVATLLADAYRLDPDLGTALWVAAATGMRRGELAGLRWSRVDLEAGVIRVDQAVAVVNKVIEIGAPKSHQRRDIDLDPATVEVLRRHQQRQAENWADVRMVKDPYVWCRSVKGRGGQPPNPDWLTGAWRRVRARRGADNIRLHDLRHFMASVLLDQGVPTGEVSYRLGHLLQSTTEDIYSHRMPGSGKRAALEIGNVLGTAPDHEGSPTPDFVK